MTKLEIVAQLLENGYHLFDETAEHFAERFTQEQLEMFLNCFKNRKA